MKSFKVNESKSKFKIFGKQKKKENNFYDAPFHIHTQFMRKGQKAANLKNTSTNAFIAWSTCMT